ncbi:hypothetical protein E5E96_20910 [Aeromonas sp. 1805]|uniref:phage tail tube protein n=1 Tax=Aeromonas sp. 1805 TaxID=2560028 RepID=UPI00148B181B|nr:hypothetical protein [Aeromonas sp. 1805]QJT19500.1 hypothetical protein E5E96_20910 [Aeromonas sp. 1805]
MSETLHLEGDLFIETFTNNVSNGVIGPVDVNSLEVKPDSEKISIPSKRKGKLGQPRETYFVPKPATVTIKTSEIPPVLLAAAFMGLESPINQGAGTLTDVALTLPAHPKWVSLGKTNLSATGLAVKEGTTPLVLGTDFEINYALGLLRATKGGAVADGGPVTVSASYNAVMGSRIAGNVQPEVKARLLLDGRSIIGGEAIKLTIPRASLAPKKAVDFLSDKPIEIELEGELLALDGETAPFYVDRPETV